MSIVISIDGSINPAVDDFIRESIGRAKANGAKALIIQLDTPGGLLSSTRTIVKEMLGAEVPVMVYVSPSGAGAGSAGVFITMAAHIAAMAPGTNIGAAHPVAGGGQEVKGVMGEKIENFTASFSESIAQKRGRNTEWAIQAVRKSVAITETEALKKNVIDIVARDIDDLLKQTDGRKVDLNGKEAVLAVKDARLDRYEMSLRQKVLNAIADPNIAYHSDDGGISRVVHGICPSWRDLPRRGRSDLPVARLRFFAGLADQLHGTRIVAARLGACWSAKHFSRALAYWASAGLFPLPSARFCSSIRRFLILVSIARSSLPPWRRSAASFWLLVIWFFARKRPNRL